MTISRSRLTRSRVAIAIAGLSFLTALAYPVTVWAILKSDAWPWIQNVPSFTLFMLFIFPVACGLAIAGFDGRILSSLSGGRQLLVYATLAILLAIGAAFTWTDAFHSDGLIPVHMVQHNGAEYRRASALRECISSDGKFAVKSEDSDCIAAGLGTYTADQIRTEYNDYAGAFASARDWLARHTVTAVLSILLTFMGAEGVAVFLWYILVLVLQIHEKQSQRTYDVAAIVLALLILGFFPTRVYSLWYINLYSLGALDDGGLITSAAVALVLLVLIGFLFARSTLAKWATILSSVLGAIIGALAYVQPQWLYSGFAAFQSLNPVFAAGTALVVFIAVSFLALAISSDADPQQPNAGITRPPATDDATG